MAAEYTFRPLTPADQPLFHKWLAEPHIAGWWSDGATEWALAEDDMKTGKADGRIVELDGQPFAYVQDYDVREWDMPQYADLPQGVRAMDTFLGDPSYFGKGHGTGYLHARIGQLLETYPAVATDPDPDNAVAIRAYTAAGFVKRRICASEDGDPVQVMTCPELPH